MNRIRSHSDLMMVELVSLREIAHAFVVAQWAEVALVVSCNCDW